jgi:hypothetical protein
VPVVVEGRPVREAGALIFSHRERNWPTVMRSSATTPGVGLSSDLAKFGEHLALGGRPDVLPLAFPVDPSEVSDAPPAAEAIPCDAVGALDAVLRTGHLRVKVSPG